MKPEHAATVEKIRRRTPQTPKLVCKGKVGKGVECPLSSGDVSGLLPRCPFSRER